MAPGGPLGDNPRDAIHDEVGSVMAGPGGTWNSLFGNVGAQGSRFASPLASDGAYYAFLSKADEDVSAGSWDVLFEVVPKGWFDNAVLTSTTTIPSPLPRMPASLYHLRDLDESKLLSALGLGSSDLLAEGSWYLLELTKGTAGPIYGDLYDPDIDLQAGS